MGREQTIMLPTCAFLAMQPLFYWATIPVWAISIIAMRIQVFQALCKHPDTPILGLRRVRLLSLRAMGLLRIGLVPSMRGRGTGYIPLVEPLRDPRGIITGALRPDRV